MPPEIERWLEELARKYPELQGCTIRFVVEEGNTE